MATELLNTARAYAQVHPFTVVCGFMGLAVLGLVIVTARAALK
jgi:hypothetical protein